MTVKSVNRERTTNGFTLVELMIVVVIVGILTTLAVPRFNVAAHQAKLKEAEIFLRHVHQAHQTWRTQAGAPTAELANLESVGYSPPPRMEFYVLPAPGAYGLPLCLVSRNPGVWPSQQVDESGGFSDC